MAWRMPVLMAGQVTKIRPPDLGHGGQKLFVVHAASQPLAAGRRVQRGSVVLSGRPAVPPRDLLKLRLEKAHGTRRTPRRHATARPQLAEDITGEPSDQSATEPR
jgi:hypothetical protein